MAITLPVGPQEYKLECAEDQLQSLSVYEDECGRKDGVIRELRRELAAYKHDSHTKDIRCNNLYFNFSFRFYWQVTLYNFNLAKPMELYNHMYWCALTDDTVSCLQLCNNGGAPLSL